MKRWLWPLFALLLLVGLGGPLYRELSRMQSVREDRRAFRRVHREFSRTSGTPQSRRARWSTFSDTVREGLRRIGFRPASLPEGDPEFQLLDLHGRPHRLRDHRGRWVLLNFWATWCPPCRMEMPSMQDLRDRFSDDGLTLLAVNLQEDAGRVRRFVRRYGLSFPVLLDRGGTVSRTYRVTGVPETWLIDPQGTPRARLEGPHRWNTAATRRLFRRLLVPSG